MVGPVSCLSRSWRWFCLCSLTTVVMLLLPAEGAESCTTWAKALQSAVERSVSTGPVLAQPEVG